MSAAQAFYCRIIAVWLLLALQAATAWAAPAVVLAPRIGPPTTAVTVAGSGFGAYKLVEIYIDTTNTCLAATSAAGSFSCQMKMPRTASPGTHWISAYERITGLSAQRPFLVRTDIAQYNGRNSAHTGNNPYENTITPANVAALDVLWTRPLGVAGTNSTPVLAAGRVYVAAADGKLYGFDAATGSALSGFPISVATAIDNSTPAVGGGRIFVGSNDSKLHAFLTATGAPAAGFPKTLGGAVWSAPALALGNVYVGCNDGKLYGFNATTGATVPGFPLTTGGLILGSPTIVNGRVYYTSFDGKIYAADALSGVPVAGYPIVTGGVIVGSVAAASGMGFVGSHDFQLYGFNLATGAPLNGFPAATGGRIVGSPAISNGVVYVVSEDTNVYGFSITETPGLAVLHKSLENRLINGSPFAANGVLYLHGMSTIDFDRLHAINIATGSEVWTATVTNHGINTPVVADGILYHVGTDSVLTAYSVHGEPVSARRPNGSLGTMPAVTSLSRDASRPITPAPSN